MTFEPMMMLNLHKFHRSTFNEISRCIKDTPEKCYPGDAARQHMRDFMTQYPWKSLDSAFSKVSVGIFASASTGDNQLLLDYVQNTVHSAREIVIDRAIADMIIPENQAPAVREFCLTRGFLCWVYCVDAVGAYEDQRLPVQVLFIFEQIIPCHSWT